MNSSSSAIVLWGCPVDAWGVTELLCRFQARRLRLMTQTVQSLHAQSCEAALLAGHDIDDETLSAALGSLTPLPPVECEYDQMTEEEFEARAFLKPDCVRCLCNKCIENRLNLFPHQTQYQTLQFGLDRKGNIRDRATEHLQAQLMEQILGKELSSQVPLRFGSARCQSKDGTTQNHLLLCITSKKDTSRRRPLLSLPFDEMGHHTPTACLGQYEREAQTPSSLDRWALSKAIKLLGLKDRRNNASPSYISKNICIVGSGPVCVI